MPPKLKPKKSSTLLSKEPLENSSEKKKSLKIKTDLTSIKSKHVVNLKNPQSTGNAKSAPLVKKPALPAAVNYIKPPRNIPRAIKTQGVNFISGLSKLDKIPLKFNASNPAVIKTNQAKSVNVFDHPAEIEDIFSPQGGQDNKKLSFSLPTNWLKKLAFFILAVVFLILPLQLFSYYQNLKNTKGQILLFTNEAIASLKEGQQSVTLLDLQTATENFDQAKENFDLAQKQINELNFLTEQLLTVIPNQGEKIKAGSALLEAGEVMSEAAGILSNSGQRFLKGGDLKEYYYSLVSFEEDLTKVIDNFTIAQTKIESVDPNSLPSDQKETFIKLLTVLPKVDEGLSDLYTLNKAVLKILGHEKWQRYLLIFLNNNELRGSGGFMGSFAMLDIDRGEIKKLEVPGGGTYDLQGYLGQKVISPEPLHLINARWEFQDSNWWPDFPTTARKIQWFYTNANGPSVDGVITITSTFMENLLKIVGPISMPEYGRNITSENFVEETQKIVELEYDREENRPKQFIADLTPKLLEKLFNSGDKDIVGLADLLKAGLNEKHLLMYFNDSKIENIINDFGWAGEIKTTRADYLSVVHTNLAGGKTDGVISETIEHTAEVQPDGSIIDTVKLIRKHSGIPGKDVFTGVQNNSYVRFYVPKGSILIEAKGFKKPPESLFEVPDKELRQDFDILSVETNKSKDEKTQTDIYEESGKTVFGNWLQLKPGEIQETVIKYKLPFKLALEDENKFYYSLLAQKQPGSLGSILKSNLEIKNNLKPVAVFPSDIAYDQHSVNYSDKLNVDKFYGVVLNSQ